jgi:hypothetical protein
MQLTPELVKALRFQPLNLKCVREREREREREGEGEGEISSNFAFKRVYLCGRYVAVVSKAAARGAARLHDLEHASKKDDWTSKQNYGKVPSYLRGGAVQVENSVDP